MGVQVPIGKESESVFKYARKKTLCFLLPQKVITRCKFFVSWTSNYLSLVITFYLWVISNRKIIRIQIDFSGFSIYYFLNTTSSSYFSIISYFTAVHTWVILSGEYVVGFEALQCPQKALPSNHNVSVL